MKSLTILPIALATVLWCATPIFAQRGGGGRRPANVGAPSDTGRGGGAPSGVPSRGTEGPNSSNQGNPSLAHSSPSDVLSHNTAIVGKIGTLTGENAQTACNGFKNLGECVAAAHVAKNLDITGGFDALKAKMTGTNVMNLGKAIQSLDPHADAKAETKKANKQANDYLKETSKRQKIKKASTTGPGVCSSLSIETFTLELLS